MLAAGSGNTARAVIGADPAPDRGVAAGPPARPWRH